MSQRFEMPKTFRPMLSATVGKGYNSVEEHLEKLKYQGLFPLYCSPKLDGIRVVNHPTEGVVTRTMKQIPNRYISQQLQTFTELIGTDGELVCGDPKSPQVFNFTQSEVMTRHEYNRPTPFTYVVFDHIQDYTADYERRMEYARKAVNLFEERYGSTINPNNEPFKWSVQFVETLKADNPSEVLKFDEHCVSQGYEGTMIRSFDSTYKFGRSTEKQMFLGKIKRFVDAEAIIVDAEELLSNQNEAKDDAFGLTKRSSHQENLKPMNVLGAMVVKVSNGRFAGAQVNVGTGFDQADRWHMWNMHRANQLIGKRITFKYQDHGSKDVPRMPVFKGFREIE